MAFLGRSYVGFDDPSKHDTRSAETKLKEDLLTCEVCEHVYDFTKYAPHQLPCGDTACLNCLRQYAGRNGKASCMYCPICERQITIPGGHVCCLTPNAGILKILEVFKLVEAYKKDFVPCMGCDSKSDARCLECQENYCEDHANFHGIVAATRKHTVVKFTDILADPQRILKANGAQMCSKHKESALEAVCNTCHALVCLVCAITEHKGHQVKEIGDTIDNMHDKLRPLLNTVEQKSYDMKQTLGMAKDVDKEMNIMFQRSKRDLNIGFMGVVRKCRDRQITLFGSLDKIKNANIKLLESQIRSIEDEINFTIRGSDLISEIYQNYSPAEIAGIGHEMTSLIENCQTIPESLPILALPTQRVTFECRTEDKFKTAAKKYGRLTLTDVHLSLVPKDPKTIDLSDSEEEEDLLPIDNSELSALVKSVKQPLLVS